jgi:hypothetical protein
MDSDFVPFSPLVAIEWRLIRLTPIRAIGEIRG